MAERKGGVVMDYHMLNVRVAKECGVNASLILVHLKFWIEKNQTHQKHFHDGHHWTYCTMEGLTRIFEYMTASQIRTAVDKLVKGGYLLKGNYNKSAYDRTAWYALTDKGDALFRDPAPSNADDENRKSICENSQMETRNFSNGFDENRRPIPDIITDKEPDIIPPLPPQGGAGEAPPWAETPAPQGNADAGSAADAEFDRFWEAYPRIRRQAKVEARKAFAKARKKVTLDVMLAALERQKTSWEWTKEGGQFIPRPASWLNKERWNDDWDSGSPQNGNPSPPGQRRRKTVSELIAEREAHKAQEQGGDWI